MTRGSWLYYGTGSVVWVGIDELDRKEGLFMAALANHFFVTQSLPSADVSFNLHIILP